MEENNIQEPDTLKIGTIALCTTLVVGYVLGRIGANSIAIDSYRRGVSDTLNSMIFTHR